MFERRNVRRRLQGSAMLLQNDRIFMFKMQESSGDCIFPLRDNITNLIASVLGVHALLSRS